MIVKSNYVDVLNRSIFPAVIALEDGKIRSVKRIDATFSHYVMPGFTDAHIHIESSMLTPYEFARKAAVHGTVATVSDPHEIANVCGLEGVYYMLDNARNARMKIHFGAPSCVPATMFETAGAALDHRAVDALLQRGDIWLLSEVMNYPGVISADADVMRKIASAKKFHKPVDGHAPGLRGDDAAKYIKAGEAGTVTISTDHECFSLEEALDKLNNGMKILIREGSAAKNFEALHPLISSHTGSVMFCSDDKHPDDLMLGHVNQVCALAVAMGHNVFDVLQCGCVNAVKHYSLPVGLLQPGDQADFVLVDNLHEFGVIETWINGNCVAKNGESLMEPCASKVINNFSASLKTEMDFALPASAFKDENVLHVIEAIDGQVITNHLQLEPKIRNGFFASDVANDVLKIAVVNRYHDAKPAIAFIKNFGLIEGAFASTVAHDSHNIIVVGVDDASIAKAVNLLIECRGGLSVVSSKDEKVLPLPVAGLMSDKSCDEVGCSYSEMDRMVRKMGCRLRAPYMTLSFMALPVIPDLKLSDKGLFNVKEFRFEG
jgi:adenine deaminase